MAFRAPALKSKLLIIELWGLGDLVLATPFLRAVVERFDVTLLAKPFALDLQPRLWPGVKVVAFTAAWTAFKNKYQLWRWPLLEMIRLRRELAAEQFEFGLSARWDPRDHLLLKIFGAKNRLGFPRLRSRIFLTQALARPEPQAHRYESWRVIACALNLQLPPRDKISLPARAGPRNGFDSHRRRTTRPRVAAGTLPAARGAFAPEKNSDSNCVRPGPARLVVARRRGEGGDAVHRDGIACID